MTQWGAIDDRKVHPRANLKLIEMTEKVRVVAGGTKGAAEIVDRAITQKTVARVGTATANELMVKEKTDHRRGSHEAGQWTNMEQKGALLV